MAKVKRPKRRLKAAADADVKATERRLARIFHEGGGFGFLRRCGGCFGQFPTEER